MLAGRFGNTSGRPYIEGRLYFPRLKIQSDISFIVDTGADHSLLMPLDGRRMNLEYNNLGGNKETVGIGGLTNNYIEPAMVVFTDPGLQLYVYNIDLTIASHDDGIRDIPSLLGRDILDRWRMTYDPSQKNLTFEVVSADITIPITS